MKPSKSDFITHLHIFTTGIGRLFNEIGWEFDHYLQTPLNPRYESTPNGRVMYLEIDRSDFFYKNHPADKQHKLNMWGVYTEEYDLYCLEHIINKLRIFLNNPNNKHFINHYADDTTRNNFIVEGSDEIVAIKILFTKVEIGISEKTYYIEQFDRKVIGGRINTHMRIYDSNVKRIKTYTFPKIV